MNPPGKSLDIYLFLRRRMARERAVYRTRAQLRRLRVFSLPAGGASTPAASDGIPAQPVGCLIAAPTRADADSPTRRAVFTISNEKKIAMEEFKKALEHLINEHGIDNKVDIPDFILADMICCMIEAMGPYIKQTLDWHGCNSICHPRNKITYVDDV